MKWTEKVSMRLAKCLKTEETPHSLGTLAHGIEIFLLNAINLAALILCSLVFHLFREAMLLFCFFYLHRLFSGGVHLRSPWTCLGATLALMLGGGYLLKQLPVVPAPYAQLLILAVVGISFRINYRYAPAEHTYVPHNPAVQRRSRFILLLLIGTGCFFFSLLVEYIYQTSMTYALAVLLQSVLLMPRTYRFVSRLANF
ncbi:accessory gene regulator ArgB-like protein [Brevibacillus sp. GCM10020057]|uniref:accessory gene regulator ArgB-like protein n=1 Tax=Brevibacillus sp. GCM10020057 TaxID=3317327 RepID=UPI0036312D08